MIVFIAGMLRSGSTFSFNVTRDLLAARGVVCQDLSANILFTLAKSGDSDHIIYKGHHADDITKALVQASAVKAICTIRKPEDAIASVMQIFGHSIDSAIDEIGNWMTLYNAIKTRSLVLHYETIEARPLRAVSKIAKYLFPDTSPAEVFRLTEKYNKKSVKTFADNLNADDPNVVDLGFSVYDMQALFHRSHVRSIEHLRAANTISHEEITYIRRRLANFIDLNGEIMC